MIDFLTGLGVLPSMPDPGVSGTVKVQNGYFPVYGCNDNNVLVSVCTLFIGLLIPSSADAVLCLTPLA